MAGLVLGPHALGWVPDHPVIHLMAEVGVMLLLFEIGLAIDLSHKGADLTSPTSPLFVIDAIGSARPSISRSHRIGVDYAGPWAARPYRFVLAQAGDWTTSKV